MAYKGKTAVITAGANGMGREIARRLAAGGAKVYVSDVDEAKLSETVDEIADNGGSIYGIKCDVSSDEQMRELSQRVLRENEGVDYLFNHAGTVLAGVIEKITVDDWKWMLDINILGTVRGINAFLPSMIERKSGYIINTASSLGLFPDLGVVLPYITSKAGIVGLSRSLFHYVRPHGIHVSVFCPDITFTSFHWSGRWIGLTKEEVDANLPLDKQQPVDTTIEYLLDCVDRKKFLVSTTPNYAELMRKAAAAEFDPSQARAHEI